MTIDTADTIIHDGAFLVVSCVHDGRVHTLGWPDVTIPVERCTLHRQASDDERLMLLRQLAGSSGAGHRPRCARERLAIMGADTVAYDVGCC